MSKPMRAKVVCREVKILETCEIVVFRPVCKQDGPYPADGNDENNTFAKWSPAGEFSLTITNPALLGTYRPGQVFYVDFTPTAL